MNQYTIKQVMNGKTTVEKNDLENYAKKNEVANLINLEGLREAIDSKVSITPQHTHKLADVDQLEAMMADKLDCKAKYSYKTILSDSEKIEHLTNPNIDNLILGGKYYLQVSDAGDLLIKYKTTKDPLLTIAAFNTAANNWILNGVGVNELKKSVDEFKNDVREIKNEVDVMIDGVNVKELKNDVDELKDGVREIKLEVDDMIGGVNVKEFKNNVEEVLKNHYEAILALMPGYTDPTPNDNKIDLPKGEN